MTACTKDEPNPLAESTGDLIVTPASITFPIEGSTQTFTVTGGTAFVRSNADWATVTRLTGNNKSSTFEVTCSENTTGASRTGTILANLNGAYKLITLTQEGPVVNPEQEFTFRAANEVAQDMYPGWNLGNTLEACDAANIFTNNGSQTNTSGWQSTETTQQVIDAVKAAGFKSVRIPCSWIAGHVSGGTTLSPVINKEWIATVKKVVDYCINDGLYVVLNDHWDGGWLEVSGFSSSTTSFAALTEEEVNNKIITMKSLWIQIAEAFKGYDEHLIFAGLNEPFQQYDLFSARHAELTPLLCKYNKAFVEAVRSTGGNNANRILVVQAPGANIESSCTYMPASLLPESAGKLMVEAHFYDPGQFCGTFDSSGDKAYYFWGEENHSTDHNAAWGEEEYIITQFEKLNNTYATKGYPVILGEYAALQRTISGDQAKHDASVKLFYNILNREAVNNGIVPFAWDTNDVAGLGTESGSTIIINRATGAVVGTNAMEGILAGIANAEWMTLM